MENETVGDEPEPNEELQRLRSALQSIVALDWQGGASAMIAIGKAQDIAQRALTASLSEVQAHSR